MLKDDAIKKLDALKGVTMLYSNKNWTLTFYTINDETERVYMHTEQGTTIDRPISTIELFLEQLEDLNTLKQNKMLPNITEQKTDAPKTFTDLKSILMENIDNLKKGKINVSSAKEICNHAQVIVNITKLELEYFGKRK